MLRRLPAVPLALAAVAIWAGTASAADFAVTNPGDGEGNCPSATQCTLRAAVTAANASQDIASTITLPAGTHTLTSGQLAISRRVSIAGAGRATTTILGSEAGRVFSVGAEWTLFLSNLTVADGSALGDQIPYGGNILVNNSGFLFLVNVRVTGGRSLNGGGIGLLQGRAGIASSLIDNNTASDGVGGGIAAQATSTGPNGTVVSLTDSTVAFNNGAGIASGGNPNNTTTLERTTIAYNRVGGGLSLAEPQASFTVKSSIVAANAPFNCGTITPVDRGQNVESLSDCAFAPGSQFPNPGLATALSPEGVLELLAGSPAIDRAVDCGTGTVDQRGVTRPQLAACDAGAFEYVAPVQTPTPIPDPTVSPTPTATPTPTVTPTPTPVVNRTVVVSEESGTVRVRRPRSSRYEPLDATLGIPVGSTVDARDGVVVLTSIPKAGAKPQTAKFWDGIFRISQARGITTLTLTEQLAPCSSKARVAQKKKPKTRRLWGDGKGKFRTKGRYSAATVRGTKWLVTDGCRYTRTRATQGVVAVRDTARGRTIIVRKGKSYTARPRR